MKLLNCIVTKRFEGYLYIHNIPLTRKHENFKNIILFSENLVSAINNLKYLFNNDLINGNTKQRTCIIYSFLS